MIKSKKELTFYIKADTMMNRGYFKTSIKQQIKNLLAPDYVMDYLVVLRECAFYINIKGRVPLFTLLKFKRLGIKCGFTIGYNSLGYGAVIPHYGTIVVGSTNKLGNYVVLQTSTCISGNGKTIGDGFYLATGAKVTSKCKIGDNVSVGANSLVNQDFLQGNVLIGGMPAKVIKGSLPWYIRDGVEYQRRHNEVEKLRKKMFG